MSSTKRILRNYGEDKKAHGKVLRDLLCWLLSKKCESTSTQFFMENPSPTLRCALNNSLQLCFMLFMQKKSSKFEIQARSGVHILDSHDYQAIHLEELHDCVVSIFIFSVFCSDNRCIKVPMLYTMVVCKLRSKYIHLLANNALNMCISATSIWAILIYGTSGHLDMQIMPQH